MSRRLVCYSIIVSLALTLLSIFFFDQPIAAFVQRAGGRSSVILQQGTSFLEVIFGFPIAKYALTYALLAASLGLFAWKSARAAAWMVLFIGCAQFVTRFTAGTLKGVFERLRPFEVIQAGDWDWKFFGGHGNSFPSGHGAYFWGLFFPLAFLFPRYRIPLLIIPLFISVARVGVNRSLVQRRPWLHRDRYSRYAFFHLVLPDETDANHNGDQRKMIKARPLPIIAFVLLLVTMGAAAQKSKPAAADYFPLRVGDSWTYRSVDGDTRYSVKVISEEKQADGTIRYLVEKLASARIQTLYSKTSDWVFIHLERYPEHDGLEAPYEPPRKYLKNPPVPGSKWEWSGKDYTQTDVIEKNQVVGFESVTVPAGKFRAMKIVSEITGAARMTKTCWYANGVGLVKTTTNGGQINYGSELMDYTFKKKDRSE